MVPDRKCDRNFKNYKEIHGGRNDDIYDIYIIIPPTMDLFVVLKIPIYISYIYICISYIYIYGPKYMCLLFRVLDMKL